MLKIYGRANSINVRKVLWAADEIGAEYEREDWGRGFRATDEPAFLKLNPFALIPVVADGDLVMRESHAIIRYLAAKHGRTDLYPEDLGARVKVDGWLDWVACDTVVALRGAFMGGYVKKPPFDTPWFVEMGRRDLTNLMRIVADGLAAGGPFISGATFTLADIPLGLVVNRWYALISDGPDLPALAAYYELLSERPAFMAHGRNGTP